VASADPWFATPRTKVTALPTSTVVELAVLLATRSGCPEGREGAGAAGGGDGWFVTATAAVAALLDPSGSDVVELAEAVFVSVRPAAALVARGVIVKVAVSSEASVRASQVTVLPAAVQPWEAETKASAAGSVSVTVAPSAGSGPLLCRVSVKSTAPPTPIESEEAVFETARSAAGVFTSTVAAASLLELSGSSIAVLALAVFVKVWPAAEAAARAVIVTVGVAPAARVPRAQVTVEPAPVQPAEAETTVSPAGSVSVTVVASAGLGPSFRRVSSKSTVPPGATATAGTLFRNCRSAAGMTSVLAVSAGLAGSGARSAA